MTCAICTQVKVTYDKNAPANVSQLKQHQSKLIGVNNKNTVISLNKMLNSVICVNLISRVPITMSWSSLMRCNHHCE